MKIVTAKTAGFCFGVERAVNRALEEAEKSELSVYALGALVHNESVMEDLKKKGIRTVQTEEELPEDGAASVIIRAHGIPEDLEERLLSRGLKLVDCTCPFVKRIHRIVGEAGEKGQNVLIIGDPAHPEIRGIIGWTKGPFRVICSADEVELLDFSRNEQLTVVVQTTFQAKKLKIIVEKLRENGYNAIIADTICSATRERQLEAERLSEESDVMIVIGSPSSSNSRKLYDICKSNCDHTYFIQSAGELNPKWFDDAKTVGITAGASTPKTIITEVQTYVGI